MKFRDRPKTSSGHTGILHGAELVRFCAAIGVAIFHYIHFQYSGLESTDLDYKAQPIYPLLAPFYSFGGLGVPLFWALSGLVFFHVYVLQPTQAFSLKEFWINRASRLLPLHWMALAATLALQAASAIRLGSPQIYPLGTPFDLVANAFLASHWFAGWGGQVLNGPVWSVSVEVIVYLFFSITLFFWGLSSKVFVGLLVLLFACLNFIAGEYWPVLEAANLFFLGGFALQAVRVAEGLRSKMLNFTLLWVASLVSLVGHAGTFAIFEADLVRALFYLFLPLILAFATREKVGPKLGLELTRRLGSLTYGIYLLHVPVQLLLILLSREVLGQVPFEQPAFLIIYLAGLILMADLAFRKFELPAKVRIREAFYPKRWS